MLAAAVAAIGIDPSGLMIDQPRARLGRLTRRARVQLPRARAEVVALDAGGADGPSR